MNTYIGACPESSTVDDLDLEVDLDDWPDCRLKYQIIVERANQGMGKFDDSQFKPGRESYGEKMCEK